MLKLLINGSIDYFWAFIDEVDFADSLYQGFDFCMKDIEVCKSCFGI